MTLETIRQRFGLSGAVLKWIAILTMFCDHFAFIFYPTLLNRNLFVHDILRQWIGRLSFPIFAFLIAEGFYKTRNVHKYAFRLFLFAIISELPFDLAFFGGVNWQYQNIFFTLFTGLLALWGMREFKPVLLKLLFIFLGMCAAEFLHFDYGAFGVIIIVMMGLMREHLIPWAVALPFALMQQGAAPLAMLPILLYNGKRGRQPKWLLYAIYPVHLLIFYAIARWLV